MLNKIWQWIKQFFQRLLGIAPPPAPPPPAKITPTLTDTEYEAIFMQLLEGVNEGWSRGFVRGFLTAKHIPDAEWIAWLQRFGENLLATDIATEENGAESSSTASLRELAQRLIKFSELRGEELGETAGDIGRQLLAKLPAPPVEEESAEGEIIEAVFVGDGLAETNRRGAEDAEDAEKKTEDVSEAKVWFDRGVQQLLSGDFQGAIASYNKALEIKPDDHQAWYNLGLSLYNLGRYEQAIASFEKALEFKSDFHQAWFNRGLLLYNLGRYEQALSSYENALEIKQDYPEAWFNYGNLLYKLGRHKEGLSSYENALEIKPDYPETWLNQGLLLYNLGCNKQALASFDNALTYKRDYWEAWIGRGNAVGTHQLNPLQNSLLNPSIIALHNPALNQRGYEGQLASYLEGLKYCHQDTHPEGWGNLHWAIGNVQSYRGRRDARRSTYWREALNSYHTALETLTESAFPETHLEVLQSLIRVLVGLGEKEQADEWRLRGLKVLQNLLNQPIPSVAKQKLVDKFWLLRQLGVDVLVQKNLFVEAIETAERDKNLYLTWILDAYCETTLSPNWEAMQQFLHHLHDSTAIIYWHVSEVSLTTFILKPGESQPIPIVASIQRLQQLEDWIETWKNDYLDYRDKAKTQESRNRHNWFEKISDRLGELREILDIPAIELHLETIDRLILIPHRDLHSIALEALFSDSLTITRLPSIQIGCNLLTPLSLSSTGKPSGLLSVEHPENELEPLSFAPIESAAICRRFDSRTRLADSQATLAAVTSALQNSHKFFHFTGHAAQNPTNPNQSSLYLAGTDELTLEEIRRVKMDGYSLVTLSACETGLAKDLIKIDYVGLVSAFVKQRVAYVVSTLWTVPEEASALLTIQFYRLRSHCAEPEALAKAKRWLRQLTWGDVSNFYRDLLQEFETEPREPKLLCSTVQDAIANADRKPAGDRAFDRPYYWAAFTIAGLAIIDE